MLLLSTGSVYADSPTTTSIYEHQATAQPQWARHGMVASQEALATQIGVDILKQGGNAVDAAVATGFALAVTLPRAGNIGGGGFMLVYLADKQKTIAIDYREMAPAKAHKDLFIGDNGEVNKQWSRQHGLAVGVPGTVMGLLSALEKYGTMTPKQVMAPAIALAQDGIEVTYDLAQSLSDLQPRLSRWPSTNAIFYQANGDAFAPGAILQQPELAHSLRLIANKGVAGFYQGETADNIVAAVTEAGGILTLEDMQSYQVVERDAVEGNYRGYRVISMPPPSSGGIHIIQMLNTLEHFPLAELGHNSAASLHLFTETMKLAYADRSEYLGDPDFYPVPTQALIAKPYAQRLANSIKDTARASAEIKPGAELQYESPQTTHYSVVDQWGNAVSNTYTLNFSYGSGLVAAGTGILLNNEMDDFSAKAGVPNGYGLIGGEANAVAPRKRPLSSMSPTIVLKDNQVYLVTGTPGGSRIISTTLQIITNVIDYQLNIAEATLAGRIHHQWLPDELRVERSINLDTLKLLEAKGHKVKVQNAMGSTQSIMRTLDGWYGSSDPRRPGSLTAGH
ncbi:gamma-glutamyltransferase [Shewanella sp. NIFS-20-20]|uniref:gamma-glutamyltransferase n=1 Tax=Shewanella sp. NIFS-20-20 TaxID=2853806 RepID=UPI001C462A03|nr:gamma-glutamyltransferase [Shewanella sp. NIFS-20-20]MBV7314310.1 gamma-glutamyltransferase [Shewanella sp. NIFS-20-20]